jgi:hypothetical protein
MNDPTLKEVKTPLARELAELVLLEADIKASRDAFRLWFSKYAGRKDELTAEEALISLSLFRDSIILFVGCFDSTAPVALSALELYPAAANISYFQWLKDIRDSYAAHKFGPFRQCITGVMVDGEGIVIRSGYTIRLYAGVVAEAKDDIISLINVAGRYLEKRIFALSKQLTEYGMAMSADDLNSLQIAKTHDVEPHEVRKSRSKFNVLPRNSNGD